MSKRLTRRAEKGVQEIMTKVVIIGELPKVIRGEASVEELSLLSRIGRGVFGLVGCWIAAALSILVPLLHFLLVPSFLLAGGVVFLLKVRQRGWCTIQTSCPHCTKLIDLRMKLFTWPLTHPCPSCAKGVTVELAEVFDGG